MLFYLDHQNQKCQLTLAFFQSSFCSASFLVVNSSLFLIGLFSNPYSKSVLPAEEDKSLCIKDAA